MDGKLNCIAELLNTSELTNRNLEVYGQAEALLEHHLYYVDEDGKWRAPELKSCSDGISRFLFSH